MEEHIARNKVNTGKVQFEKLMRVIDKLEQLIDENVRPGKGLIGNAEQEAAYYQEQEEKRNAERAEAEAEAEASSQARDASESDASVVMKDADDVPGNGDQEDGEVQWIETDSDCDRDDYQWSTDDWDEDEDDEEDVTTSRNYVQHPDSGEWVHLHTLFGRSFRAHVEALYSVDPIVTPPHMTITPHAYQLKAAAQADALCRSRFRGMLLGDGMGVGKTLTAILAIWLVKDEPGFSMVVCPKTLCHQWMTQIQNSFEQGHHLTAHLFEGGNQMTAHDLLALGVDVIVASYEQVDAAGRGLRDLPAKIAKYRNGESKELPKRPIAALHTPFWRTMKLPIKRLVLDEAQVVNKHVGARHKALKRLYYQAVIVLSGTLAHNKWHNFSGLISFLQGHPFTNHQVFMRTFSSYGSNRDLDRPDLMRKGYLQLLLQAFTIARPASVLRLKDCFRSTVKFDIGHDEGSKIDALMENYRKVVSRTMPDLAHQLASDGGFNTNALLLLTKAQLWSIHRILAERAHDEEEPAASKESQTKNARSAEQDDAEVEEISQAELMHLQLGTQEVKMAEVPEARHEWLERLRTLPDSELLDSGRVQEFIAVYEACRLHMPNSKMVVFSAYLTFLDILAEVLIRRHGITALRYDGTVPQSRRPMVEQAFRQGHEKVPLFLTASCGGFGLNITAASIVIQTEPWWNANVEEHALARAWRQGQTEEVVHIRLEAECEIDAHIVAVRDKKTKTNQSLMAPLIRVPGDPPAMIHIREPVYIPPYEEAD